MAFSVEFYRTLALSVRYDTVLFPLESTRLLSAVAERGFITPESAEQPPLGARLGLRGTIARKGGVSLSVNGDKQTVGVNAKDIETLLDEFESIENAIGDEFELSAGDLVMFYELLVSVVVKTDKHPVEELGRLSAQMPILGEFSEIIGNEVAPFGIRIAPKDQEPNQSDWFDIRIEPSIQAPSGRYVVEVVYRHSSRNSVLEFIRSLESTIESLIGAIEA